MELIRTLLGYIIKMIVGIALVVALLWLIGVVYPGFSPSQLFSSTSVLKRDWLPAPKNYRLAPVAQNEDGSYGTVYKPGPAFNGYASSSYVTYAGQANESNVNNQVFSGNTSSYAEKSLYIRNLSVYEGGNISYGITIVGEARGGMFKNGSFTVLVVDPQGRVLGNAQAINTGTWSVPGWARFQVTIPTRLPTNAPCGLIFLSANQPIKVALPVRCNG
jgi:hypothetical protein